MADSLPESFRVAVVERDTTPLSDIVALKAVDLLVVDHYGWTAVEESRNRPWARKILVIDDLADREHDADMLVDPGAGRRATDYKGLVPPRTPVLAGPRYAVLRQAFSAVRSHSLSRRGGRRGVDRILVSFGAVDGKKMTSVAVEALAAGGFTGRVDIFLAESATHYPRVVERVEKQGAAWSVHPWAENIAEFMAASDLAIGAAGVSALERCAVGLPSIIVQTAENQQCNALALAKAGAAISLGHSHEVTVERLTGAIDAVCKDPTLMGALSRAAAAQCDGAGVERILGRLEAL